LKAEIISVGTELLLGDIVNTNAQFIAQHLSALGLSVYNQQVVGDNPDRLRQAAMLAKERSDIVIYTGGLGPTDDDLTKQTVASVYNDTLEFNQKICDDIQDYFTRIGRNMTENNRKQAYVPVRGRYLENNYGTAPGIVFIDGEKMAILMPGVPREMKPMMEKQVVPMLSRLVKGVIVSRYVHTIGYGESALEEKISLLLSGENPTAALYAKEGEVTIRLTALAPDRETADVMLDKLYEKLDSQIHNYIYGVDVDNIETVLVHKLQERKQTVATAESCTGGGLSARITSVPGASDVFSLGVCTYSDRQKHGILGVDEEALSVYTAVSSPVVCQMAQGILSKSGADYAIATTGYAGPGGGTPQEPVGTVYIAVATKDRTFVKKCSFSGERARITHLACQNALDLLRCVMDNLPCEGVRVIDNIQEDDIDEEQPKKKHTFLKAFFTFLLLILISAGIAAGYLRVKNGGKLTLPEIDLPAIVTTVTDTVGGVVDKIKGIISPGPESVARALKERQSADFFSQGFEKSTLKMVSRLRSQNPDLEGWLTFRYSGNEYPLYYSKDTLPEDGQFYYMAPGTIADYRYISGFDAENFYDLTDLDTVRENSAFTLFENDSYTDYQIFAVGTFSAQDISELSEISEKQEYIVQIRARSLFDVDVIVQDGDKMLVLVQILGDDRYILAFAVHGSRSMFPSVDTKTMAVYSDWYMAENNLTDELFADALLYAQEVYDRDNWQSMALEDMLGPSSAVTELSSSAQVSQSVSSSQTVSSSQQIRSSQPTATPAPTSTPAPTRQPVATPTVAPTQQPTAAPDVTATPQPEQRPEQQPTSEPQPTPQPTPEITEEILTVTMNGQVVSGPATQILSQIVAIEMTYTWSPEALKAQAIAAHTYLKYQYGNGVTAPEVAGRTSPNQRVIDAVSRVSDLIMTVNGRAVYTPYTASVAGRTNPASQVWGTAHSHLVSVESKYDYMSSGYEKVYTIPAEEMKQILDERIGTDLDLEKAGEWFEIVDYTDGGYVRRMSIDGVRTYISQSGNTRNITGNWFATDILADAGRPLRSAAFTISYADGNFTIVTQGYGHGVGLSQWGAQLYATQEGWSYDQILRHYYTGVTIQPVK